MKKENKSIKSEFDEKNKNKLKQSNKKEEKNHKIEPKKRGKVKKDKNKDIKKTILKEESLEKSNKKNITRNKLKTISTFIFICSMLSVLVIFGFLISKQVFRPQSIAKFLDPSKTIAMVEINTDLDHKQFELGFNLLKGKKGYSKESLIKKLEDLLGTNYEKDIKPWLGRRFSIAAVKEETGIELIYFAEINNKLNADKYIKNHKSPDMYFEYIGRYMAFSKNKELLNNIIENFNKQKTSLFDTEKFTKVYSNLPVNKLVFAYIDFDLVDDDALQILPEIKGQSIPFNYLKQFTSLFDSEGLAFVALKDKFALQTFTSIKKSIPLNKVNLNNKDVYNLNLASLVSSDVLVFWGGEDVGNEIDRIVNLLSGGKKSSTKVVSSILDSYVKKYFGNDISLDKDILPLMDKEFAVTLENINGENVYKLFFELNDLEKDTKKLSLLSANFAKFGAMFRPEIVEHKLEDGTISNEIMSTPTEISLEQENYKGFLIKSMVWGDVIDSNIESVHYTIIKNVAVISSNLDSLKATIDKNLEESSSLKNSEEFTDMVNSLSVMSDEVAYFDIKKLIPLILENTKTEWLDIISSVSSGKIYFTDGISSINYIHIN